MDTPVSVPACRYSLFQFGYMEHKKDTDETIGLNVARLREKAGLSMDALAEKMRDFGNKWTRSTVFKVEHGNRSLKFSESVDLLACLGADPVTDLFELAVISNDDDVLESIESLKDSVGTLLLAAKGVSVSRGVLFREREMYDNLGDDTKQATDELLKETTDERLKEHIQNYLVSGVVPDVIADEWKQMSPEEAREATKRRFAGFDDIRHKYVTGE